MVVTALQAIKRSIRMSNVIVLHMERWYKL